MTCVSCLVWQVCLGHLLVSYISLVIVQCSTLSQYRLYVQHVQTVSVYLHQTDWFLSQPVRQCTTKLTPTQ